MYSRDGLHVDAVLELDGTIRIEGQDLRGEEEYEYVFTIAADHVPALGAVLGGEPLGELERQGEQIVTGGEMHWLEAHGVPYTLTTW